MAVDSRAWRRHRSPYAASQAREATISAATPVSSVGCRTGANRGLWFVGISPIRPACFRLRIDVRIGAADEPEDRGRMPLNAERPEILAGGGGIGLPYAIGGKICLERVENAARRIGIVRDERVAIDRRDLRRASAPLTRPLRRSRSA